ncbi:Cytochrome P450 [Penicillium odoratum]|uniref:Cytochrome P450 n=1 Tax=Penicillium odoratum TaxID=1167516 RepID=UPI002547855C|nr:Cytochrome P450 [Penicillium odoratum]KAJ5751825.1 Cytochrome P450 [Penicillium odoratum]
MILSLAYWPIGQSDLHHLGAIIIVAGTAIILITAFALVITSRRWANTGVPFVTGKGPLSILYQHYRFIIDGPGLIKEGCIRFSDGLFEIPRTFRPGQVILCKPELIEELKNACRTEASPEPWIDQLLQISHVMPGYFPKGGGWPAIAKTTPGVIRGTLYKQLDRYVPSMNAAVISQLGMLEFTDGECSLSCFDFAYSVVARSGSFSLVGEQLAGNEEYLKAVKEHILGMIMTTRLQFLIPDALKGYFGGFFSRLAVMCTKWNMHASRKILLKHFDARAAEYKIDMSRNSTDRENQEPSEKPVEIFHWLYEISILRQRWTYSEVIGEMLLLQFAFIYTTAYGLYGALAELAQHPEYIPALREEVETTVSEMGSNVVACDKMVLMDSFLKECQRIHPPAAVSAHRVCVTEVHLSNGVVLKPGTHIGVPSGWIQRSSKTYMNPEVFDGFRFAKRATAGASGTKLVDVSPDYLVFGMGVHACPGRWMASVLMKLALAHLVLHFDILPDGIHGPLTGSLSFEEFYVPNFGLKLRLRRRSTK